MFNLKSKSKKELEKALLNLEAAGNTIDSLKYSLNSSQEKVNNLNAEVIDKSKDIANLRGELTRLRAISSSQCSAHKELQEEADALSEQYQQSLKRCNSLQTGMEETNKVRDILQREITELEQRITGLETDKKTLSDTLALSTTEYENIVDQLRSDKVSLTAMLEEARKEIFNLKNKGGRKK